MTNLQSIVAIVASIAAIIWGFHAAITRPMVKHIDYLREDVKALRNEMAESGKGLRAELKEVRAELKEIHTELKSHGERLARVEERLPPPLVHR